MVPRIHDVQNSPKETFGRKPCKNKQTEDSQYSVSEYLTENLMKPYENRMESHGGKHIPARDTSQRPSQNPL